MLKSIWLLSAIVLTFALINSSFAQTDIYDSGGPLTPEQASYDIKFYDLDLVVSPSDSSIKGSVGIKADFVHPVDYFVVDLDTLLTITKIEEMDPSSAKIKRDYRRKIGKIWIALNRTRQAG